MHCGVAAGHLDTEEVCNIPYVSEPDGGLRGTCASVLCVMEHGETASVIVSVPVVVVVGQPPHVDDKSAALFQNVVKKFWVFARGSAAVVEWSSKGRNKHGYTTPLGGRHAS